MVNCFYLSSPINVQNRSEKQHYEISQFSTEHHWTILARGRAGCPQNDKFIWIPYWWVCWSFHFIRSPWTSDFTFDRRKLHVGQGALCTAVAHLSQHPQGWLVTTIHPCHRTDDQKKLQGTHAPHQTCLFSQWFRIMLMNWDWWFWCKSSFPNPKVLELVEISPTETLMTGNVIEQSHHSASTSSDWLLAKGQF